VVKGDRAFSRLSRQSDEKSPRERRLGAAHRTVATYSPRSQVPCRIIENQARVPSYISGRQAV
jgi:hypothetical protein